MDVADFADSLAARGRYDFTSAEAARALGASPVAVRAALRRLRRKGRLAMPLRGFHVIVPPEYRALGCLPADQFVPHLMEHLGIVYYAGLLTAAQYHGAAHQAPQVFQVVVAGARSDVRCGRVRVAFIVRRNAADMPTVETNTVRGTLRLSSPETTAFDLVGYPGHAGGLSNVATVLAELAERLDARRLADESARSPLPWAQRLGFLLERVGAADLLAPLAERLAAEVREYVPLATRRPAAGGQPNRRWKLLVNEAVEPDL